MPLNLTKEIINNRITNDFLGAIIVGKPGSGKTVYTLTAAREIGYYDDSEMTKDSSWGYALNQVVHTLTEFANALKGYSEFNKRKILIWDDAGVEGGTYAFTSGFKTMKALKSSMDLIRTSVECLLITTPSFEGLSKFIRDYDMYKIEIKYHKGWYRRAYIYHRWNAMQGKRWRKKYIDNFYCRVPNKWYKQMYPYRLDMTDSALVQLVEQSKLNEKKRMLESLKIEKELKEYGTT